MNNYTAYCDTSFILEYWQAFVENEGNPIVQLEKANRPKYFEYIKSLLKSENRHERLKPLRRLIDNYSVETNFISSFFALTELYEKHAEWNFKAIIADATNIDRTFNKGKKEVGDLITKVFRDKGEERDSIFYALFPHELDNSLFGIEFKDIENLSLSRLDFHAKYAIFSILQLGTTDMLHLLAAKHLNAKYFLTFDSDFNRVKDIIKEVLDLQVVFTPDEMSEFTKKLLPTSALKNKG